MEYRKMINFDGDPEKALGLARTTFTQAGYLIVDNSESSVSAKITGVPVRSRPGSLLCGASPVTVSIAGNQLIVEAGFEGVARLKKFLLYLLIILGLSLGVGLAVIFFLVFDETWPVYLGLGLGLGVPLIQLPIHVWLTPLIFKRLASRGLDTLLHNMVMVAK